VVDKPALWHYKKAVQKSILRASALVLTVAVIAGCSTMRNNSAQTAFENLPANCNAETVGRLVSDNLLQRPIYRINNKLGYPEVCMGFGGLRFAAGASDKALEQKLIDRYAFILKPEGQGLISTERHVDFHVFGALPLEIYLLNGDTNYLALGLQKADEQWADPLPSGIARESRFWVDDAFMVGILQIQAYRATHNSKYAERAATELAVYLDKLQQPNGLFFHADTSHHYWGRGNGWFAVAMAEVLSSLPHGNPRYARLMEGYTKMMASLKNYQSPSGLWRQLVDDPQAWDESSCSGMFTYAMIVGVQHGWLDGAEYGPVARRGWIGLCGKINPDGNVRDVCVGTGQRDDTQYYLDRPRVTGDPHGEAPVLWCAWALLKQ
jgi:unsaturated rhamnogalacturonyl hydrolase